jgi:hypothetical protein
MAVEPRFSAMGQPHTPHAASSDANMPQLQQQVFGGPRRGSCRCSAAPAEAWSSGGGEHGFHFFLSFSLLPL